MRNSWVLAPAVLALVGICGCSSSKPDDAGTGPKITAPINNNAPQAATAPAAPGPGPDVPRPGKKFQHK